VYLDAMEGADYARYRTDMGDANGHCGFAGTCNLASAAHANEGNPYA
jgi:hypothetical protein